MTVHKPVGLGSSIAINVGTATTSGTLQVQTKALRVVATAAAFIGIGTSPTATATDYYVPTGGTATIALNPASQRVTGITTGTTTIIDFPQGTGSPFVVGDYVSLTSVGQSYYNFTHQPVTSVNTASVYDGYYSTRITVSTNTAGILSTSSNYWRCIKNETHYRRSITSKIYHRRKRC